MTTKEKIIEACIAYENGKMMRDDSEVEIDLFDDEYWLCDYSESRGSAEAVRKLCNESEITANEVIEMCMEYKWAHCL